MPQEPHFGGVWRECNKIEVMTNTIAPSSIPSRGAVQWLGRVLQKSPAPRGRYYNLKGRIFESKFPIPARFGKVLFTPGPKIDLQYEASRCANPPVMTVPSIRPITETLLQGEACWEIDWSGRISKSGDAMLLSFGRAPPSGVADTCCRGRVVEPRA
jgi:hypothetical protein